jgi:hypothetical protein
VSPISKRTGKRYAAGSQKKLGGYETPCQVCGHRIVLARGSALHSFRYGSFCGLHMAAYPGQTKGET